MIEPTPAQVHAMCAYLESSKDCACIQCPAVVKTDYGYGTGACYAIAEETLQRAHEILCVGDLHERLRRCREVMEVNDPTNARDIFGVPAVP